MNGRKLFPSLTVLSLLYLTSEDTDRANKIARQRNIIIHRTGLAACLMRTRQVKDREEDEIKNTKTIHQ